MRACILASVCWFASAGVSAESGIDLQIFDQVVRVGERPVRVSLVVFDEAKFTLRLIDNAAVNDQPRFTDLETTMQGSGCVAGCNGGFFIRKPFDPFGLMMIGGKSFGSFDPNSWLNALLIWHGAGMPAIELSPTLKDRAGIEALLQTGPWLVRHGEASSALDPQRMARRTFLCRDAAGHWALGACEPCTLQELATLLKTPVVTSALKIEEAINLDGGPSTGLWVKQPLNNFYLREGWPVRNYIGVVRRG